MDIPENKLLGFKIINEILDELINPEDLLDYEIETPTWYQQLQIARNNITINTAMLKVTGDSAETIAETVRMKLKAEELVSRIAEIKKSPIIAMTDHRSAVLDDIDKGLQNFINNNLISYS